MTEYHQTGDKIVVKNSGLMSEITINTEDLKKQTNNKAIHEQGNFQYLIKIFIFLFWNKFSKFG